MTSGATRHGWRWTTLALAVTIAAEIAWRAADARLPSSDAGALGSIADAYWALGSRAGAMGAGLDVLLQPGGWHAWLVAGALRTFGRTLPVFDGVSTGIWAVAVLFAGLLARRRGGDRAGAAAALLVAAMPWLTLLARRHGPQALEATVAAALLYVVSGDRGLARVRTVPLVGVLGAALLALGGTSWVWAGTLLPVLLWPGRRPRPWRLLAVLAAWVLGAAAGSGDVGAAFALAPGDWDAAKLASTFGRVRALVDTPAGVACTLGAIVGGVATVGALRERAKGGLVPRLFRRREKNAPAGGIAPPAAPDDGGGAVTAVLLTWVLVPLGLGVALRPSPEAYPAAALALAVLASRPLARSPWGFAAAALAWGLFTAPQGLQPPPSGWVRAVLPADAGVRNVDVPYRPHTAWDARTLGSLLDATCRSDAWASCGIVIDQGLAAPDADEPGRLARFLLAEDRVALLSVYDVSRTRNDTRAIHALLTWDCGERDDRWRLRAPDATARVVKLAAAHDLLPVWSRRIDPACTVHWLTPRGELADRSALPAPDPTLPPWTPRGALASLDAFYGRHPSSHDRQGRAWTARAGDTAETVPTGWSADGSAWRRGRARGD